MTLIPGPAFGQPEPVTHAFVVGVSAYPFLDGPQASPFGAAFGMEGLTSAARSASDVAAWLLEEFRKPEAPLATLRVLLSPADGEALHPTVAAALPGPEQATRAAVEAAFEDFAQDCRTHPDNFAFVYIAGHGVQLTTSASVVLLHDFADPSHGAELKGAIDVSQCHHGLSGGGYPNTQVWFADACRQVPEVARRFETLRKALDASKPFGDVEASALILGAGPRESAFADVGGSSIFSQALLWCLRGGAATACPPPATEWYVRAGWLATALKDRIDALTGPHGVQQNVETVGRNAQVVVQRFERAPEAEVEVALKPEDAQPLPTAHLALDARVPVPLHPGWPLRERLPAGMYLLRVDAEAPLTPWTAILDVKPPAFRHVAVVGS